MAGTVRRVPRQGRSRQRYEEILEASSKLFSEAGFDSVTTNDIAARAGMSIGALYQYFSNKEAIVAALSESYLRAVREITDDFLRAETVALPVEQAVERLMGPVIEFHTQNAAFSRLWLGADTSPSLKTAVRGMDSEVRTRLETQLKRRLPAVPSDRVQIVASVIQSALKSLLAILIRTDDLRQQEGAAREMKRMIVAYVKEMLREHDSTLAHRADASPEA